MSPSDWHLRHKELTEAGLIVQSSAVQKIEKLQSLIPLIEAANSSGVRLLDGNTVEELMSIVPQEIDDSSNDLRISVNFPLVFLVDMSGDIFEIFDFEFSLPERFGFE